MITTGLTGNEWFCLNAVGLVPGELVVGNCVNSLGFVKSIKSGVQAMATGELTSLTAQVNEGRVAAISRLEAEARAAGAVGVTGLACELKRMSDDILEFLAVGSAVHRPGTPASGFFSAAGSAQDLYCQIDAGYHPRRFVTGNVAYKLGLGGGLMSALRGLGGGEVVELSNMIDHTRRLALERIEAEAQQQGANAIVDVKPLVLTLVHDAHEMLMVGTASHNSALGETARPVTSSLTGTELWNLARLGFTPVRLVLASSIYSLGVSGSLSSMFSSFAKGELTKLTKVLYEARENCMARLRAQATEANAEAVIGTRFGVGETEGGYVDVFAIGTAIKKTAGATTRSEHLLPQAMIEDRDTVFLRH